MMNFSRTGLAGFFIASTLVISGCSDSSSSDEPLNDEVDSGETVDEGTGDQTTGGTDTDTDTGADTGTDSGTDAGSDAGSGTDTDAGTDTGSTVDDGTDTGSSVEIPGNTPDDGGGSLVPPVSGGNDLSGGDDDSPTAAETASLSGPSIKDESRSAGPPSVPTDLTLLLAAENWIEFTWAPSSDDQAVKAYEIYRDNTLIATVNEATVDNDDYEHDIRSWLSTSFIDCNYTRYTDCASREPVPGASYSYTVAAVDNEGMRSEQSEPAVFTFEQLQGSTPDLSDYVQVFDEEFDGTELDRTLWKAALPWGPDTTINGEMQYFVNVFASDPIDYTPFEFTGETMIITGKETPAELLSAANNKPYISGVITTSDYFEMTYGYVEMSAKVASGEGLLSTFYLFNQDFYKNKPEIDIAEYIGSRPDKVYQTYHYYDSNRARSNAGEKHSSPTMETVTGEDLSAGFHKYSVLWEPELVVWYVDGQEVRRMTGPRVSDEPMNIIAHLVVGSSWIGEPSADVIPAEFEIDYIKAWQKQP